MPPCSVRTDTTIGDALIMAHDRPFCGDDCRRQHTGGPECCEHEEFNQPEIILNLVTADDVIIAEDEIDLKKYSPEVRKEFIKAFHKEIKGLATIGCFGKIEHVPAGFKAIPLKAVWKIKFRADGTIDKYKVRSVVQGFRQRFLEHFFSTSAPTGALVSLRMIPPPPVKWPQFLVT